MTKKAAQPPKRTTQEDEGAERAPPKPADRTPPEEPLDEKSLERVMRDAPL